MAVQMIFCVETNKNANTDSIYITETINRFYEQTNKISRKFIYLGSKSKYNDKETIKQIAKWSKDFTIGETKVVYFIDTDMYERNPEHKKQFDDIKAFCDANDYGFVWFCHDVEEVYLGRTIEDSKKVSEAGNFRKKKMISAMTISYLCSDVIRKNASNILTVLDEYFERKKG